MPFRMPDWLNYEMQHKVERFRDWYGQLQVRETLNNSPKAVFSIAMSCVLLFAVVLLVVGREAPARRYPTGRQAWFYDLNTRELFVGSSGETGPIEAPSGPLPDGRPAGLRAHVYSFVSAPKESDLFVGFLEIPDPQASARALTLDLGAFDDWTRGRLIKRVDDDTWVSPASVQGQEIIQGLTRPNRLGQTPMYHMPE